VVVGEVAGGGRHAHMSSAEPVLIQHLAQVQLTATAIVCGMAAVVVAAVVAVATVAVAVAAAEVVAAPAVAAVAAAVVAAETAAVERESAIREAPDCKRATKCCQGLNYAIVCEEDVGYATAGRSLENGTRIDCIFRANDSANCSHARQVGKRHENCNAHREVVRQF
jgi:hypothetical protein